MKILHLIPTLSGGGAELQLSYLSQGLIDRGWNVHVAFGRGGVHRTRLENSSATLHEISNAGNFDPRILSQILKIISSVKPDIVQTWLTQMDILGGISALLTGSPLILTERTSAMFYENGGWRTRFRLAIGARATAIIANSEGGQTYWSENAKPKRIYLIRNGLPLPRSAGRHQAPQNKGDELILYAGRFSPEKNVLALAEAFIQVVNERPQARAIMFGEGILKDQICKMRDLSGVGERLSVRAFTADLTAWLNAASVFVSASLVEGHPNTVLEAAASRCPLVLSDIDQHREIMDESAATFCSVSTASLAQAIEEALSQPAEAVKKTEQAYLRVQEYSVEKMVQEYVRVYEEVLQAKGNSPPYTIHEARLHLPS